MGKAINEYSFESQVKQWREEIRKAAVSPSISQLNETVVLAIPSTKRPVGRRLRYNETEAVQEVETMLLRKRP